mgnify:CR=1 FL=1
MRCFLIGFAGFFVAMIVTLFVWAQYADYAARVTLSETMGEIAPLREKIAEIIKKQRAVANSAASLTQSAKEQTVPRADYVKVASDGTIVFRSAKHGQIIVFEPSFRAGEVAWKCIGSKPEKNIPKECR